MNSRAYIGRINTDIFRVLTVANPFDAHILRVEATPDLSVAKVFVNKDADKFAQKAGFFRNEIAQNINLRKVPNLKFIIDDGEKNTARVEELLKIINGEKK
jgi:ribosome-binding factor A